MPGRGNDPHAHSRIETAGGVLPRVRAERDTDRFARARAKCDPEVIDVGRHAIDFGGEGNGRARDVNQIAVAKLRIVVPARWLASMRQ